MSVERAETAESPERQSPAYLRTSLAAALTLGLSRGLFHRDARLHCINLLLTYPEGCRARCAYCGLSGRRIGPYGSKSFIRVPWPTVPLEDIVERIAIRRDRIRRICLSMIAHARAVEDTKEICSRLRASVDIPVSLLIAPTLVSGKDLEHFRAAGADKIGVAIDLATPELFERHRGSGVGGPHRWEKYWSCLSEALAVFGPGQAGAHLMVGMGETDREMCRAIQRVRDMGGRTHLFSFYPEAGSLMEEVPPPPLGRYRRVQIARYLIDGGTARESAFRYDRTGGVTAFGVPDDMLDRIVGSGEPFRTSGCTGGDGEVACNRPFANSRPGEEIRNYPFSPEPEDLESIRRQLQGGGGTR
ncbi:MAG: radical SAM protein [bacterium]